MDSGEGLLFWLFLIAIAVAVVFAILAAIASVLIGAMGVTAAIFACMGAAAGVKNAYKVLMKGRQEAKARNTSAIAVPFLNRFYEKQPADLLYFYDQGWFEASYLSKHVWEFTRDDSGEVLEKAREYWDKGGYQKSSLEGAFWRAVGAGAYVGGLVYYIAAFVFVAIVVVLLTGFMVGGIVATSIAMAVLGGGTWLYGWAFLIFYRCPICHHQMAIPVYICPYCGERHTRLWPSIYGVFYHRCRGNGGSCNQLLPTLSFLGRSKLTMRCPNCDHRLYGVGSGTNIHIPIVGGPATGKSHYIVMATKKLIEDYAPAHGLTIALPDPDHQGDYDRNVRLLNEGKRLPKTSNAAENASAFLLLIRRPVIDVPKLLYIYDAAGEYFAEQEATLQQRYFDYEGGVLFVVDPFSIDAVKRRYAEELSRVRTLLAPSSEDIETVFENTLNTLEQRFQLRRNQRFPHPIAVVLTKSDAFDLETRIGEEAGRKRMREQPEIRHISDAIHLEIEDFLIKHEKGNFVRNLQNQFERVRFFSCSSVGKSGILDDGTPFSDIRVLEPILWILGETQALSSVTAERARDVDTHDKTASNALPKTTYWRHYVWDSLKPIEHSD